MDFPGDSIVPSPQMFYNIKHHIHAPPADVLPWILQLGKGRGGWYLPASWERFLPKFMHGARTLLLPYCHGINVGDRVPDYGFDEENDFFEIVYIAGDGIVYKREMLGTYFTWGLFLREVDGETEFHLRFRGRLQSTGIVKNIMVTGGRWADWACTWPMLRGLAERAEKRHI